MAVKLPPARVPPNLEDTTLLEVVMHEYDAIRSEVDHSLTNQISILSFGAATVGLLVAAAGAVWKDEPLLAGVLLLVVVPATCFLIRVVHAGEMVRLMRAGLFLHELENWVNRAELPGGQQSARIGVLRWEQWAIREEQADADHLNSVGFGLVFSLLAYGFMLFGFLHLHRTGALNELVAVGALLVTGSISLLATFWAMKLNDFAYRYRSKYSQPERLPPDRGSG
jgi:hypothetical protein